MTQHPFQAPPRLHLVVTCANRKLRPVSADLRLRDLHDYRPDDRFATWVHRLGQGTPTESARGLYGGEHWQIARDLAAATSRPATLWVCSAGYGLIGVDTAIHPYAATFSLGQPDSAGTSTAETQNWWHRLTQWHGPASGQPRSFTDLARRDPNATIVAVLSEAYLRACADDLRAAAGLLVDTDRFVVIGPSGRHASVDDLLVPVTGHLQPVVGGSLQALNVRVAAWLLTAAKGQAVGRCLLRKLAARAREAALPDPNRRPPGRKLTDDEVRAYIHSELAAGPATATGLLRRLRASGRSCEQARFRDLFIGCLEERSQEAMR